MRNVLETLEKQFAAIDRRSRTLLSELDESELYRRPNRALSSIEPFSCGEFIARSAAEVEKTFGGITTRLWDDPYEWTLPEKLATIDSVVEYLDEVAATREKGLEFLQDDADLARELPAPETLRPIGELLVDTVARAAHFQGRAFLIYQIVTGRKPPRL
jgi:hypothetical protein